MKTLRQLSGRLYRKNQFGILFFLVLCADACILCARQGWFIDSVCYAYHLVDFSAGFSSKLIVGALSHLIFPAITVAKVTALEYVILALVLLAASVFAGKFVEKFPEKDRTGFVLLAMLCLTGPFSVSVFCRKLGMLDVYWVLLFMVCYLVLNSRYNVLILPVLAFVMVLVNYPALICYVFLLVCLLLYEASDHGHAPPERKRYLAAAMLVAVLTSSATVYFITNEQSNLPYTESQFNRYMLDSDKTQYADGEEHAPYTDYYDYYFYGNVSPESGLSTFQSGGGLIPNVKTVMKNVLQAGNVGSALWAFALTGPMIVLFVYFWLRMFRAGQNKLRKFVFAVFTIQFPVVVLLGFLGSSDVRRWTAHAFMMQAFLLLYVSRREPEAALPVLKRIVGRDRLIYLTAYFFLYNSIIFEVYS